MKKLKKLIAFIALLTLVVVGANAAIETYDEQESVYYNLFTLLIENDLVELFATQTEVQNARDGEANLLAQIDDLQLYKTEVTNARDGEANLLAQVDQLQSSIVAVTGANGSLVSSNDTVTGFLNGKLVAGEGVDLTEGNDGGDETFTISAEDATTSNKGVASFNTNDFTLSSGAVSETQITRVDHTGDYTLTANDMRGNKMHSNVGAAGAVNLTLPAMSAGYDAYFFVGTGQYLRVTINGSATFRYRTTVSASGGYIRSATTGRFWRLLSTGGIWLISDLNGPLNMDE